jgi:hypothetical protein
MQDCTTVTFDKLSANKRSAAVLVSYVPTSPSICLGALKFNASAAPMALTTCKGQVRHFIATCPHDSTLEALRMHPSAASASAAAAAARLATRHLR